MPRSGRLITHAGLAVVAFVPLAGCALVLGGLDEGSPRADLDASDLPDAPANDAAPSCPGSVPGYRFRRPLAIDRGAARTNDYTVTVPLPTDDLLRAGKLQPSGADYLFTDDDGRPLPFALEERAGTAPERALLRLDLRAQPRAWLHFGNPAATLRNDVLAPYAPGLVDDPTFARRDGWTVSFRGDPADSEPARWSVAYEDEGIRFVVSRSAGNNGTGVSACQTVTFPDGSSYRIVFDTAFSREGSSTANVSVSGLGRGSVWGHSNIEGENELRARQEETLTFGAGTRVVCLNAILTGGGRVDARFSRIRVRRVATHDLLAPAEPVVTVLAEERSCP